MTALSADRLSLNPPDNSLGHALFAESFSDSICRYRRNDGVVLVHFSPRGPGKPLINFWKCSKYSRPKRIMGVLARLMIDGEHI
jgi:hypothetical protein